MMNRRDEFVLLFQTHLLVQRPDTAHAAISMLQAAMEIPEEALPKGSLVVAVVAFRRHLFGGDKPPWLIEHEENTRARERAEADQVIVNTQSSDWWAHLSDDDAPSQLPKSVLPLLVYPGGANALMVPRADAEFLKDWVESLPFYDSDEPPFQFRRQDGSDAFSALRGPKGAPEAPDAS